MATGKRRPPLSDLCADVEIAAFPETHSRVIAAAAAGNWEPFLQQYLQPCWREVTMACRQRRVPLSDAADVFQEFMLRLLRSSRFGRRVRGVMRAAQIDTDFQGNLPARYLKSRELPIQSARFRKYLKAVIRNLVLETVRRRSREPTYCDSAEFEAIQQTSASDIDRQWLADCLLESARRFREECAVARTRARRRLSVVLYRSVVQGNTAAEIAREFGVDRTTIAGLLVQARERFIRIVQEVTGIDAVGDLKSALAEAPEELRNALKSAGGPAGNS